MGRAAVGPHAAEYPIYGRYGYGSAAPEMYWTIKRQDTTFRTDVEIEDGVELVDAQVALRDFPAIHDAVRATRPGMLNFTEAIWQNWAEDPESAREGFSRKFYARLGDRGYVVYRATTGDWADGLPRGTLKVVEHMAVDAAAAATLWRYVFDHDLIDTFRIMHRPTDDLLPLMLANPRGLTGWQYDGMWLRLIDIPAALSGRTYATEGAVSLGVVDSRLPDNRGTWALEGGPDDAACRRTDADADLHVDIADLGGAYLGHLKFSRLVRAGRAQERTPGAAARADLMFTTDPAPWCQQEF